MPAARRAPVATMQAVPLPPRQLQLQLRQQQRQREGGRPRHEKWRSERQSMRAASAAVLPWLHRLASRLPPAPTPPSCHLAHSCASVPSLQEEEEDSFVRLSAVHCMLYISHPAGCCLLSLSLHFIGLTTAPQLSPGGLGMLPAAALQRLAPAACAALLQPGQLGPVPPQPAHHQRWQPCNLPNEGRRQERASESAQRLQMRQWKYLLQLFPSLPRAPQATSSTAVSSHPIFPQSLTLVHGALARLAKAQSWLPLADAHVSRRHPRRRLQRAVPVRLHEHCARRGGEEVGRMSMAKPGHAHPKRHAAAGRALPHLQTFPG